MEWRIMGWFLAKLAATACALPGMGPRRADALGRALRWALPWRLGSECSRSLAGGVGARLELSWLFTVLLMGAGLVQMAAERALGWGLAEVALGALLPWILACARKSRRVQLARGQLWLAMLSSSELGGSMGHWPAGPTMGRGIPGWWRQGGHAGFIEMARRLGRPLDPKAGPESVQALRARARLRAMMLACAGSEQAARWLWRRRKSQWSMARWAKSLGEGAGGAGERWELAAAVMSIATIVGPSGGEPLAMDASEATESSIPMLWALPSPPEHWSEGCPFQVDVRRECMRIAAGVGAGPGAWGWRMAVEEGAGFKQRLLRSLEGTGGGWRILLASAPQLLEQEQLAQALSPQAIRPVGKRVSRL